MKNKNIVLCADDYGQSESVSTGIIALIQQKRISATSCLVTGSDWLKQAARLQNYQNNIDIGLHFNLTEGTPLSSAYLNTYGQKFLSLPKLIGLAYSHCLNQSIILSELYAQLDCFIQGNKQAPQFIDGHHHIHQLPIIRSAILKIYRKHLCQYGVYIRLVNGKWALSDLFRNPKKIIIYHLGAQRFKTLLTQQAIPHNHAFSGIYSLTRARQCTSLMLRQILLDIKQDSLVMCHPGLLSQINTHHAYNQLTLTRYIEYQYLMSQQFIEDCETAHLTLSRWSIFKKYPYRTAPL